MLYQVASFIIYPNFWDKVLSKIKILYNIFHILLVFSGTDISNKILSVVHIFSLIIMTYLKMLLGIKSLNTKQFSARLSPPPVKLSSFIVVTFSPKKESNLWLLLIFVFVNPRNFMISDTRVTSFNIYLIFENEF